MTDADDPQEAAPQAGAEATSAAGERPPPPPPTPGPAPAAGGIRYSDRVLVLGQTGSGKSVLLNHLLTGYRCQRLLLDTKWEFTVAGVEPVSRVESIDWDLPVVHYRDERGELRDYDRLFDACLARRSAQPRSYGLVVCVHELADLCGHQPGATPTGVNAYITKGRAHGLGLLAGSQRPVNMPRTARSEAQHVFAFAPGFDPDDRQVVAKLMQLDDAQLRAALDRAAATSPSGEHAYLWFDQRARRLVIRPPLPPALIARSIVQGIG